MEFREREGISFEEAERRHAELERRYDAGQIDAEQFDIERQRLLVVDDEGRWWAISREGGRWLYHDSGSGAWIEATPPAFHRRGIVSQDSPEQFEPPKRAEYDGGLAPHRGAEEARPKQVAEARAAEERYCLDCGVLMGAKSNFCVSCGEYLVPEAEALLVSGMPLDGMAPKQPGQRPARRSGTRTALLIASEIILVIVTSVVAGLIVGFASWRWFHWCC